MIDFPSMHELRIALGITAPWAELPDPPSPPWFVRIALGGVAWIGGSFLLGFVAAILPEQAAAPVGLLLLAVGIALRWIAPATFRDFWLQASLLAMVAARGALFYGLSDLLPDTVACFALVGVEVLTLLAYPGTAPRLAAVVAGWTWFALAVGATS